MRERIAIKTAADLHRCLLVRGLLSVDGKIMFASGGKLSFDEFLARFGDRSLEAFFVFSVEDADKSKRQRRHGKTL